MDDAFQKKLAANEAMLREANEAIERGLWPGDEERIVRFRCECARFECNGAVELTITQYEAVRANPRRFVVVPGHDQPGAELVVESHDTFAVVEKIEAAGAVAEESDPRS